MQRVATRHTRDFAHIVFVIFASLQLIVVFDGFVLSTGALRGQFLVSYAALMASAHEDEFAIAEIPVRMRYQRSRSEFVGGLAGTSADHG